MVFTIYQLSHPVGTISATATGVSPQKALETFGAGRYGYLLKAGETYLVAPSDTAHNIEALPGGCIFKWQPPVPSPPTAIPVTL